MILDHCRYPLVLAPLAGGPSTPALAAAVTNAGGMGTLAWGYLDPVAAAEQLAETRQLTDGRFGVNVFVPGTAVEDTAELMSFRDQLRAATWLGVEPGEAVFSDDHFQTKVELLRHSPVDAVSFTFGLPPRGVVAALHAVSSEVWVTVTTVQEALDAADRGADALIVQGLEAGGHRGGPSDHPEEQHTLLTALQLIGAATTLPLIATGGLVTGRAIAGALTAGATGVALGTAFLSSPEAGTSQVHRDALRAPGHTALTRAFTGRSARGICNAFMEEFANAPVGYPEIHYMTDPIRQAGRLRGDSSVVNLWAGTAFELATEGEPAGALVSRLAREAAAAVRTTSSRWTDD